nr:S-layer homology domain-containing protein [uncultured Oscillibacter sp.]
MKKFLSLVLALIMTMSLVTISAGATEYRDLTDKEEIQYEEAVAVLNRIGVITGYEDGSFRPETELTRGAAAKIIVSLMIGPDAAAALPNNASPYPDVPAGHTFAGVIGYCKTAGYISGYGDGTFKPANPLTGYAFAKMLLGAVGYKANIEGFVDTGWTMNVARIGNVAGLFDRLDFDGAAAVTRDAACQLALNTLKATMVDYGGNNTVVSSTGEVLTVQGSKAQYVTSNNRDINANINRRVINAVNNEMTLEFGEEHFKDLRLEHDKYDPAYDVYGHPSNEWSYKKVTIGTFPLEADFTYTDQIVHREATAASKEKALGLRGYDTWSTDHRNNWANWSTASSGINNFASPFADETQVHINGWHARVNPTTGVPYTDIAGRSDKRPADALTLSEIADLTDNGVTVEVYVCPVDADFITDVVVTRTQLMEVDRVAADYVRLKDIEPDSRDKSLGDITGYNAFAIDCTDDNLYSDRRIEDVKDDNYDAYKVLKDMKAGDKVAVIPYTEDDNESWEVGVAYAPETVTGTLTRVDIYNSEAKKEGNAVAITVGGTSYKINEWNEGMLDIKSNDIKSTRKDVTLYLAKDGTALQVTDVGNAGEWMIVADYWQGTNDAGKVVWYVHGYTIGGDEVDLDLGTIRGAAEKYAPGELVRCQINTASGGGEYILTKPNNLGSSVKKAGMYNLPNAVKTTDGQYTHPWDAVTATSNSFKENPRATGDDVDKNWEGVYRVALGYGSDAAQANDYNIRKSSQYLLLDGYGVKANGSNENAPGHTNRRFSSPERQLVNVGDTVNSPVYGYTWDYQDVDYASGVKFVYVSFDSTGEVESIYFADGKQDVDNVELRAYNSDWRNVGTNNDDFVATTAEAYVNEDGNVETVVIKTDSADADLSGIRVITKNTGSNNYVKSVGADATESELLKGKWTEREYVQGPDFKENKTGIFDKEYDVGDILIGSERNGIFYAREFHGDSYRGNSLDGLYIKGISKVENTQDNTLKDRFSIIGSELRTLDESIVLKSASATTSANAAVQALLNQNNDEVITDRHQAGVILGGSAKVIDVRVGHEGEITKLKDLFDYDLSKVVLKVLLNGKSSDAGFRSAYAIVILEAPSKKDNAGEAWATLNVRQDGKKLAPAAGGDGKEATPYVYTVKPDVEVTVTPTLTGIVTKDSVQWTDLDSNLTFGKNVEEIKVMPGSEDGDTIKLRLTIVNRDDSKKDSKTATSYVYVNLVTGVPESDTYTLKVQIAGGSTVFVNGKLATSADGSYQVPKGASVEVYPTEDMIDSTLAGTTQKIGNVAVTFANTPIEKITFKMTDDLDLVLLAQDVIPGDPTEVVTITLNGGVTATYKADASSAAEPVVSGASVKKDGTLTITGKGDGAAVVSALNVAGNVSVAKGTANGVTAANALAMDVGTTIVVDSNIELWSATVVKTTGADVTAKAKIGATEINAGVAATNGLYVPVGTTLAIAGGAFDGYVASTDTNVAHGANTTSLEVTGATAWNIYGAYELNMGDGVKAKYGTGTALADGDFVNAAQTVSIEPVDGTNTVVVADKAGKGYGAAVAATPAVITKGEVYEAYTKVTTADTTLASFKMPMDDFGNNELIAANTAGNFGFKSGTRFQVIGGSNAAKSILVSAGSESNVKADAADASGKISEIESGEIGSGSSAPTATIIIADRAMSFKQEA